MRGWSARRVRAVARKELLHVVRDPRSLGMAVAIPMLLLVLFGYALTLDVDDVPLVIRDQDCTPASRDLVSRFLGSRYFSLQAFVRDEDQVERAIDAGEALVALVIPVGFAEHVDSGGTASVQLIADGSDSTTAALAIGYAEAVVQRSPGTWPSVDCAAPAAGRSTSRSTSVRGCGSTPNWRAATRSSPG